ncbi:MAG: twin-arginine translocase TatA/TatE family subunit [Bacteroidetes bacterium]|nr:twin-arginine translocase TatA/TatE family subunit [Bacteroidota bacterium]
MFGLGTPEIILIVIVILVLFGAKKIPEFMQGIGKGVREFKKATSDIENEITDAGKKDEKKEEKKN